MQTAITNIIEVENLRDDKGNSSVARVNRDTGELYINKKMFAKIPPIRRKFILFHEAGHATLNTSDEKAADDFALKAMLDQGESLTEILKSLTCVLAYNKPSHYDRTGVMFNKLRDYDYNNNNNLKVLNPLKQETMNTPGYDNLSEIYEQGLMGPAYDDFLGFGKGAKERRQARKEKKAAKTDILKAKADSIRKGTFQSTGSKILGTVGDIAGKFLGKKADTPEAGTGSAAASSATPDASPSDSGNKTMIIVAVVVVVIIIIGFVIFRAKKK